MNDVISSAAASGAAAVEQIQRHIREVPDFPKPGISFKDITPLIEDGPAFHVAVDGMARATEGIDYSRILSAEARGFVFGTALAYRARKGLVLARKPNKLPRKTASASYELEYGSNTLEIHVDAVTEGTRVLVVDDLLATGGTARAMWPTRRERRRHRGRRRLPHRAPLPRRPRTPCSLFSHLPHRLRRQLTADLTGR